MRRRMIIVLLACFLLGAVTNVVVAMACAKWVRIPWSYGFTAAWLEGRESHFFLVSPQSAPGAMFVVARHIDKPFGVTRDNPTLFDGAFLSAEGLAMFDKRPWWAPRALRGAVEPSAHDECVIINARGWPALSLQQRLETDAIVDADLNNYFPDGSEVSGWSPLWLGTLINTGAYSIAWLVICGCIFPVLMMLRAFSQRWRVFLLVTCLMFGIVVTCAVAWVCAAYVQPVVAYGPDPNRSGGSISKQTDYPTPYTSWSVYRHACLGAQVIESHWTDGPIPGEPSEWNVPNRFPNSPPEPLIPSWTSLLTPPDPAATARKQHECVLDCRGWPMLAMWSAHVAEWDAPYNTSNPEIEVVRGIELATPVEHVLIAFVPLPRTLPLGIIWHGFAIDTLIFGYAMLQLFAFYWLIRHSRRWWRLTHGRCGRCNYPIGVSAVCTECGAELPEERTAEAQRCRGEAVGARSAAEQ